jgi:thioester reductase-like protein
MGRGMPGRRCFLLTGATGFLGQYLLCDLLLRNEPVAVLARNSRGSSASERVDELIGSWSQRLGRPLSKPITISADLTQSDLGLAEADRRWIERECHAVLHSAACVAFREAPDGEPWQTNVRGLEALLETCSSLGIQEWHHISTAFVSGKRTGEIAENELDRGQEFHNCYEQSKFEGEKLVRRLPNLRSTFYRPSVIVGDSRTGHTTSYTGFYRFLEMASRLCSLHACGGSEVPLRLPLSGQETWNLVTVDWVSQAIVELMLRPECHGQTYHLVSSTPVSTSLLREVGAAELGMQNVKFAGSRHIEVPSELEQLFMAGIEEYWPYLEGNPHFSTINTSTNLPELPDIPIDRALLERLIRFAIAHRWGRSSRPSRGSAKKANVATEYARLGDAS